MDWKKILGNILGIATLGTVLIAGGYTLGRDYKSDHLNELNEKISSYEKSNSWKLPETLKNLNSLSDELSSKIELDQENKKLKKSIDILEKEGIELKSKFHNLEKININTLEKNKELNSVIKKISNENKEFVIKVNESVDLIKNHITLGVEAIYGSSVKVNVNNNGDYLNVGNRKSYSFQGMVCDITLKKIYRDGAEFNFLCN